MSAESGTDGCVWITARVHHFADFRPFQKLVHAHPDEIALVVFGAPLPGGARELLQHFFPDLQQQFVVFLGLRLGRQCCGAVLQPQHGAVTKLQYFWPCLALLVQGALLVLGGLLPLGVLLGVAVGSPPSAASFQALPAAPGRIK